MSHKLYQVVGEDMKFSEDTKYLPSSVIKYKIMLFIKMNCWLNLDTLYTKFGRAISER